MTSHTRLRHRTVALVLALTYASLITQLPLTSHAVEVRKIEAAKLDRKAAPLDKHKVMNALGKTPISFEANHGQAQRDVKFLTRGNSYSVLLGTKEAVLHLERRTPTQDQSPADRQVTSKSNQQARVSMKFIGANSNPRVTGQSEISGKSNYFIGKDPKRWRTGVTNYSKVRYQEIYQGVDLVFYGKDHDLEYDFIVAPGADPNQIRLEFKGADKVSVDAHGDLVLQTSAGELRHHKPSIYQEVNGERQKVDGRYTLQGSRRVGFELANYDRAKERPGRQLSFPN